MLGFVRQIVEASAAITFTNSEALAYQERILSLPIKDRAFVLNHIAPEPVFFPDHERSDEATLVYAGTFSGKRTARPLLKGFALYLQYSPSSSFYFVGPQASAILPEACRLKIAERIKIWPWVKNPRTFFEQASILVAVDSADGEAVFLSTKLIEYLVVNRPVLLLSPRESPGAQLTQRFCSTVKLVCNENARAICEGMIFLKYTKSDKDEYLDRFKIMEEFNGSAVAALFLREAVRRGII
jgi:hypothetical protein